VLVPERNKADLDEVPLEVKNDLEFIFVSKMDQVLEAALETVPGPKPVDDKSAAPAPAVPTN
jgi:ATP-dependent Lon protease